LNLTQRNDERGCPALFVWTVRGVKAYSTPTSSSYSFGASRLVYGLLLEVNLVDKVLNIYIFLTRTHRFTSEGLYYPSQSRVEHFYQGWMWFDGLLKTLIHSHYKAWKSQDIYLYNFDCIRHIHLRWL